MADEETCRSCARGNHRGCHDMQRRLPRDICCCGLDAIDATPTYGVHWSKRLGYVSGDEGPVGEIIDMEVFDG